MDILTEYELRAMCLPQDTKQYTVKQGTFITPGAKEYLADRGIELIFGDIRDKTGGSFGKGIMSYTPIKSSGNDRFVDYITGQKYSRKPEHMTHMRGNMLVSKTHPRILFRGKLDSLEALIMQTQIIVCEEGYKNIADELDELLTFVQHILAAEVKDEPLQSFNLLGMDSDKLRYASHHVKEEFGVEHSVPHYSMGKASVALNTLRTYVRETELAAANAFIKEDVVEHSDIIEALNRLSSCVYIIFCKKTAGKYDNT